MELGGQSRHSFAKAACARKVLAISQIWQHGSELALPNEHPGAAICEDLEPVANCWQGWGNATPEFLGAAQVIETSIG
jgi:hypothetical protein